MGASHHGERPAGGARHQGERAARAGPRPGVRLHARTGDIEPGLPERGRQGRAQGVRGEAQAGLAGQVTEAVDPRAPCIIGVAQRTWRPSEHDGDAPEPLSMWEEVARAAAADTGTTDTLA